MGLPDYARWFKDIKARDIASVGGKNASLGEMYSALSSQGVQVPNGFALTAGLYRDALTAANAWTRLTALLRGVGGDDVAGLASAAAEARSIVHAATGTDQVRALLAAHYRGLEGEYGTGVAVAVRSSATAEDLPTASFAGQHESFLNVRGLDDLFEACRHCFASVFTDRAIVYRNENGFDHLKIGLSVGVMKMVHSDRASSGVVFTLDTESGFPDVVFVTGGWGLGENIVQGSVDPDEFYVHKPTFRAGRRCVLRRSLGGKQRKLVYADGHGANSTVNVDTPQAERERFCLNDEEVLKLADYALRIEEHYSKLAGHDVPMDIEWAKDGPDGELFIVQARPETVASRKSAAAFETFRLQGSGPVLLVGRAVGETGGERRRLRHRRSQGSRGVPCRRRAGRRDDQSGLGTDHEEGRRHRHRPRRSHLSRRHHRARARHSRHRRHGQRDAPAPTRRSGYRVLRRGRHRSRLCRCHSHRDLDGRPGVDRPAAHRRSWSISAIPTLPSRRRCGRTTGSAWRAWNSSSASISASIRWPSPARKR